MEGPIFELKNWYMDIRKCEQGDMWTANGNCYGNPKFHDGDMICTAQIKRIKKSAEGFFVRTENSTYMCRYDNSMETLFQWFKADLLSEETLSEEEQEFYQNKIFFTRLERLYSAEQALSSDLHEEEYILITFSNKRSFCFEDFLVHLRDKELHLKKYVNLGFCSDSVLVSTDLFELEDGFPEIDFRYYPREENRVQFYLWENAAISVFIKNIGTKDIVVDTYCGRFKLKPNGKAYRIAPDAIAGRCAKYSLMDDYATE